MPWPWKAAREAALQRSYDEAYNSSLQSILRESNNEYHAALDSWKQTLNGIEVSLAALDLDQVRHAQEKSLLTNINDIERQCYDRINFLETRLFHPSEETNPYGTGSRRTSAASINPGSKSSISVSRVAVGSKSSAPPIPPPHMLPPMPRTQDMPYKKYTTTPTLPRSPPPKPPLPNVAGSQPALSTSAPVLASAPKPASKPVPRNAPEPGKEYTLRGPNSKKLGKSANKAAWLAWGKPKDSTKQGLPSTAQPASPTSGSASHSRSASSSSSIPRGSNERLTGGRGSNERLAGGPGLPPVGARIPRSPNMEHWESFAGAHKSESPESSAPSTPTLSQGSSPTGPSPVSPAQPKTQPRKVNRYVVTKSGPPTVVPSRNSNGGQSAALKAATLTAAARRTQAASQQQQSRSSAPTTGPRVRATSPETRNSRPTTARPNQRATVPANRASPAPQSRDEPELEAGNDTATELDEWDIMAREKIKQLRGVDENAAIQILSEVVLKGDPVHWEDIAGLEKAKASLKETVVYPFLRPDLFSGLREPALGMLLFGPPGTGKTMLARAVATESKSTFFSISASSLTSKYMGESEKLVRALFQMAKALAPSIIFVDEIDSILTQRSDSGEHEASRRIKNEFLVQWSDLQAAAAGKQSADSNVRRVLVLGATNLPWAIDEAARRRFVRRQYIPLPEIETRRAHLGKLLSHQKHGLSESDIEKLVVETDGYSGSDLTALAKDAAMGPLRSLGEALLTTDPDQIRPMGMEDFEQSMLTIRPSVSPAGLQAFEQWSVLYGSSGA